MALWKKRLFALAAADGHLPCNSNPNLRLITLSIMSRQSSMLTYHEPTTSSVMKKQHVACYDPMPGISERRFQRLN